MPAVRDYTQLICWQKVMQLVEEVYRITNRFPREERAGLRSQMRRAAISIPSNIAEGQGRDSIPDFVRFLAISRGSLQELQTQLLLSQRLSLLQPDFTKKAIDLSHEVYRLLSALTLSLKRSEKHPRQTPSDN
jgi:four helix bundle protein